MSFPHFLKLPLELRNQIYASHFRTTTLTYPSFTLPPLLLTSRQIHTEALPFLRPNALHNLLTTEHFFDFLTSLTPPASSLPQLRRISVRSVPLPVYPLDDEMCYHTHLFFTLLPLFPGLQLDTLVVRDAYHGEDVSEDGWGDNATYNELGYMIEKGKGWKELVFTSSSDRWLQEVVFDHIDAHGSTTEEKYGRDEQPGTWDRMIKEKDGEGSGARVEMWWCQDEQRGVWEKVVGQYRAEVDEEMDDEETDDEAVQEDDEKVSLGRVRPSIMVKVTRGKGADYVQDGRASDERESSRKLREMLDTIGWKEMKARQLFIPGAEDDPTGHL